MHFYRTPVSTEYLAAIDAVYTSIIGIILLCCFIKVAVLASYLLLMKNWSRIRETIEADAVCESDELVHDIKIHLHVGECREECRGECSENREGVSHENLH